jgi:hypothetical protein
MVTMNDRTRRISHLHNLKGAGHYKRFPKCATPGACLMTRRAKAGP